MFNYDAARVHAALNDLPVALLLVSVFFDLLGAFTKRESLKAAGFWTLVFGALGAGAAVVAGLFAEEKVEHTDAAHAVMETHETLAFIVLGLFAILAVWRVLRRGVWSDKEQPIALTAGVIGVALLVYTSVLGGRLVFEHGAGIPTTTLKAVSLEREAEREGTGSHEHGAAAPVADSARAPRDTAGPAAGADTTEHRH